MAQQVNLCSPILMAPRRHFSARRLAQAFAVLAAGLALLSAWALWDTVQLRKSLAEVQTFHDAEKLRLQASLTRSNATPADPVALEQELARVQQLLAERQQLLQAIDQGRVVEGQGPATRLALLARTLPTSSWLTDVKLRDGRLLLAGQTLQPDTLPRWLDLLSGDAALRGQVLALQKVERSLAGGAESWAFVAAAVPPAPLASGAAAAASAAIAGAQR